MTEPSLEQIQGQTLEELTKMCEQYRQIYDQLRSLFQAIETKLPYFRDDQAKMSALVQEYNEIQKELSELSEELALFDTLEEDEKAMVFLMAGQSFAAANQFTMHLMFKLADTEHGSQFLDLLKF